MTEWRRKVRSREVQILKVESFVLKKKKEYESEEGEVDTHEGLQIERHQRPIRYVVRQVLLFY
jgi:hypothetical protein